MDSIPLSPVNPFVPRILAAEKDFIVIFKPPRLHSAPRAGSSGETVFDYCVKEYPEIAGLPGRMKGEGGLLHRLDYETQGIMLAARTMAGMESLMEQQKENRIIKEYSALAARSPASLPGFPRRAYGTVFEGDAGERGPGLKWPFTIGSAFRPYGPGRKAVRPITGDMAREGGYYITEIIRERIMPPGCSSLRIRIYKGFRHQIRCHLAWLGLPILNDSLYGGEAFGNGYLALRACALSFRDPSTGEERAYAIPPLEDDTPALTMPPPFFSLS